MLGALVSCQLPVHNRCVQSQELISHVHLCHTKTPRAIKSESQSRKLYQEAAIVAEECRYQLQYQLFSSLMKRIQLINNKIQLRNILLINTELGK